MQGDAARRVRFESLVAEIAEPLRRFLARRTDPTTAEDVLAETLLVCWRRLDEVPEAALPWAYGVARLTLSNAQRSARRQHRVAARIAVVDPPVEVAPGGEGIDDDTGDRVAEVLARLPERDAELLRLWAWEQLGPAEIARVLDVSPNAVSIRLHRARQKFRDELRKIDGAGGHEAPRGGSGR